MFKYYKKRGENIKHRIKSTVIKDLPKTAQLIENSIEHYIDIDGNVYCRDLRGGYYHEQWIKKAQTYCFGYKYCTIVYNINGQATRITKRVHRLVAQAFIPNPNNYNIVGHKNNIKDDNRVENLYWTTTSENTKKAFDDGLAKNDKGFEDSQSYPVQMFDSKTNKLLGTYGSACEATRETGANLTTILRQAKYHRPVRKPYYFRFLNDNE